MMNTVRDRTYTSGQVARAVGLNPRRIEGWAEAGLVRPRVLKGATKHGDRRAYGWGDVVVCAVLAELQRLLGTHLRPGGLVQTVVDTIDPRSAALLAGAKAWDPVTGTVGTLAWLVLEMTGGKPRASVIYKLNPNHLGTALVINLCQLGRKLEDALNGN